MPRTPPLLLEGDCDGPLFKLWISSFWFRFWMAHAWQQVKGMERETMTFFLIQFWRSCFKSLFNGSRDLFCTIFKLSGPGVLMFFKKMPDSLWLNCPLTSVNAWHEEIHWMNWSNLAVLTRWQKWTTFTFFIDFIQVLNFSKLESSKCKFKWVSLFMSQENTISNEGKSENS